MRFRATVLSAALLLATVPALGWGSEGHRIVGDIAWHYLSPQAKEEVRRLMPDDGYRTLFDTATWADRYARSRASYDWAKPLHNLNVNPGAEHVDLDEHCPVKQVTQGPERPCLIGAIPYYEGVLKDDQAGFRDKVEALRWLSHFVGDIHQPLHVSHPDNIGGNNTWPLFFGENKNLHWVWDTGLILKRLEQLVDEDDNFEGSRPRNAWRRLSDELRKQIGPDQIAAWSNLDPVVWAEESFQAAKAHAFDIEDGAPLGQAYADTTIPVVEQRLKQGGVRLALMLNAIFAEGPAREAGMQGSRLGLTEGALPKEAAPDEGGPRRSADSGHDPFGAWPGWAAGMFSRPSADVWPEVRAMLAELDMDIEVTDDWSQVLVTAVEPLEKLLGVEGGIDVEDVRFDKGSLQVFVSPFAEPARVYFTSVLFAESARSYDTPRLGQWFFAKLDKRLGEAHRSIPYHDGLRYALARELLGSGPTLCGKPILVDLQRKNRRRKNVLTPAVLESTQRRAYSAAGPPDPVITTACPDILQLLRIQEDGAVAGIEWLNACSDNAHIERAAQLAARGWRFRPAYVDGCPANSLIRTTRPGVPAMVVR